MQTTFVLLGEALIDRTYGDNVVEAKHAGGGALNASVGISRLGNSVTYVSHVGNDENGDLIRNYLRANNVSLVADENTKIQTSIANALIQADGSPVYEFVMKYDLAGMHERVAPLILGADAVHTGSIGSFLPPGCEHIYELFKLAKPHALKSYDPNCRPSINGNHAQVLDIVERFVALANYVKASDEDVEWLYPGMSHAAVSDKWIALGASIVAITRGHNGALISRSNGTRFDLPGRTVDVQDTIGAGDSFMAASLSDFIGHQVASENASAWVSEISDTDVKSIFEKAILFSADTCTRAGANPPDLARAKELLAQKL